MSFMSGNEGPLTIGIVDTFSLVNTDANWLFRTLVLFISSVTVIPPTDSDETPVSSLRRPLIQDQNYFLLLESENRIVKKVTDVELIV